MIRNNKGKGCLYILIASFLILRYSPLALTLGELAGGPFADISKKLTGVYDSISMFMLIISIFLVALYIVFFHFHLIKKLTSKPNLTYPTKYILLVSVLFLILLAGSRTYSTYIDEERDFAVFNIIKENGISAYLDNLQLVQKPAATCLSWAQALHPPLHYIFAASLLSAVNAPNNFWYYRILFILSFYIWLLIIGLYYIRLETLRPLLWSFCLVPFVYSYLRNYVLIRAGIEFFAFIGISTYMFIIYLLYKEYIKFNVNSIAFLFISLLIAVWGKYSSLIAASSLLCSLIIIVILGNLDNIFGLRVLDYRKHFFLKILITTICLSILVVTLYALLFCNTFMFKQHIITYGGSLSKFLPYILKPKQDYLSILGSNTPLYFLIASIAWYSPVLLIGFAYAMYQLYKRFRFSHKISAFDFLIFMWLVTGVLGVLCINAQAKYTSPLTFGFVYFIFRGFELATQKTHAQQFYFICFLFACTEVLLVVFS
jgi:hypothetical protein